MFYDTLALVQFSVYLNQITLPLINYIPLAIFLSTAFFTLTLVLNQTASTRINLSNPNSRTFLKCELVNLYKI